MQEAYQEYYIVAGKKMPKDLYRLYLPVVNGIHTWTEMSKMYEEELENALLMVEIMNKEIRG